MGLVASARSTKARTPAPEGTHLAICVQVIDIGTQHSDFYNKDDHKIILGWELPNEPNPDDGDKPFLVWKNYTVSLHKKASLRLHLEAWRGKKFTKDELEAFHLKNVLGKACYLSIAHSEPSEEGVVYANVGSVMSAPKGVTVPAQFHETILFDIDEWDDKAFATFSENLQNKILKTKEGREKRPSAAAAVVSQPTSNGNGEIPDDGGPAF